MLTIFPLLLFLPCGGIGGARGSTFRGNSSDMLSLLDFKNTITGDPKGALRSWNATQPPLSASGAAIFFKIIFLIINCKSKSYYIKI